jgi:fatty-acyl-CoA synthase
MFIAELDHPQFHEFDLSSLRTGIMAGAPCPIKVMQRVIGDMHCREITIACGMTETSPGVQYDGDRRSDRCSRGNGGKVMPHQEQKIVDPGTGKTLPVGRSGELCYRGYHVMRGYYNNPEGTRHTIEILRMVARRRSGEMDEEGYVRITGRLKDMICRGGEKIFPREGRESSSSRTPRSPM